MNYKTTAIISAYFCEQYLDRRIQNLLSQSSIPDIIAVCKEDSEENAILENYPVRIITTEHIPTLYAAWNIALKYTDSEFVTIANSDDLFEPSGIEILESLVTGYDIGVGRCWYYSETTKKQYKEPPKKNISFSTMLYGYQMGPMPIWNRRLNRAYGNFNAKFQVAGDYEFWLRCLLHGATVNSTNKTVGTFTVRKESISHSRLSILNAEKKILKSMYGLR